MIVGNNKKGTEGVLAPLQGKSQISGNTMLGIIYMIVNVLSIAGLYVTVKKMEKDFGLGSSVIVFIYKFTILVLILPWCLKGGFKDLKTEKIWLHVARGCLSIAGSLSIFYAMKYIKVADATAVGFFEQILLVIIGAVFFGEKLTKTKIGVVLCSLTGVMIVIYPSLLKFEEGSLVPLFFKGQGFATMDRYFIFVFMAIGFWAVNCSVVKLLGRTEKSKVQTFYVMLISSLVSAPFAFLNWQDAELMGLPIRYPTYLLSWEELGIAWDHVPYFALLALFYFIHVIAFFKALQHAELSMLAPLYYSKMVFIAILAYFVNHESPEAIKYVGYTFIVIAGLYLVRSEARKKRRQKLREAEILQAQTKYEQS
jgi:S-adenosylmethionine uptake transporter